MEDMQTLIGWIIIIFGILQIILFFKIWGMTDDTKKIKNILQANDYPSGISRAKIEFILGNTEKAKEMAIKEFICDIFQTYSKVTANYITEKEYAEKFNEIERKYREMFEDASSIIDFSKFSTYKKADKMFR